MTAFDKGKVERQIQYLRHAFFAARPFRDLDDLNAQFRRWRDDIAHQRRHPEQRDRTVGDVLAEEQPRLLPLPAHPFETDVLRAVRSGKTPYVRFDRNQYSIPHTHVRHPLTLVASATTVRLLDGQTELARHRRSYDTGQTIEDAAHLEGLLAATHQANIHTARDRLRVAVPATALTRDALGAGSIAHLLEIRRRQQGRPPPLPLALPNRPGVRDLDVRPHRLESYDALTRRPDDPDE